MTLYGAIFYGLAGGILAATVLAATRREPVHAVLWLVVSFLGTAMLFYLLGAPLPAALEVIVYAGAIMVLFLFIVMLVQDRRETGEEQPGGRTRRRSALRWIFPVEAGLFALWACFRLALIGVRDVELQAASASPAVLGRFLFDRYWLPVEIVSLLLFVALVGTLFLGKFGGDTYAETNDEVEAETGDGTGRRSGNGGRGSGAGTAKGVAIAAKSPVTDWRNEP
jgi:NADH-quinone oxidoreductase subunit J